MSNAGGSVRASVPHASCASSDNRSFPRPSSKQAKLDTGQTAYELAARPGTGHAHWVHMPQGKLKNSVQSLVCKGSPSLQLHQDRGREHWPCKNSQVLQLQNNLLELKGEVQVNRRNVCNTRERKEDSLNDQTEGCFQDGDSFPLLILREWGKAKPLRRARKCQLQGALSQKSDTRLESSRERQMTVLLESNATAAQAAGNRQGKKRSDAFAPLSWSSYLFMLCPLPFGSLQSPVILFQVWKREIKRKRSSTAGEQRYLLCHAVLVQLPEGVPMLKYSPLSVRSCLLLPE